MAASGCPRRTCRWTASTSPTSRSTALGRLDRKGAPDTFDAWGYAALLRRLRDERDHVVYAPGFERDLEQPIAGALAVPPEAELVVTEGNYLLLDRPEWRAVREQLDEVVHLVTDDDVRRRRLVARHVEFGKTPAEAEAWVARVDDANAALVEAAAHRADRVELHARYASSMLRPDCPCGSATPYDACCGVLHRGERRRPRPRS